jgi:ribosomal protein S18 acetylase RimI-like enzyme
VTGPHADRSASATLRPGRSGDLDALLALEQKVFTTDVLSRRSFRRFLAARASTLLVAHVRGLLAGYVLVLYPSRSGLARLYSIAVAPHISGRGIGPLLLAAAEKQARRHGRRSMRLEVHEHNTRAIARYEKSGYRLFGRHRDYYEDHGDALRFEKMLDAEPSLRPGRFARRPDLVARCGFDSGHRGRRSRQSLR